jgi:hypothetical protein
MANYYGDNIRPKCGCKIKHITQSWLYDTGAAKSCMNTKTFCQNVSQQNPSTKGLGTQIRPT